MIDNANADISARPGLGNVPQGNELATTIEYTPYELVNSSPAPVSVDTDVTPAAATGHSVSEPATPVVQTLSLPKFNFSTGVAVCTDCTTTSSAVASTAAARVTPLPAAPKTTNWLLYLALAGVGVLAYRSGSSGLSGTPEPQPLGRPPRPARKPTAPVLKHVGKLVIK